MIIGRTQIDYDQTKENSNRKKHGYSLESAVHFFERLLLPIPQPPFISRDVSNVAEQRHEHMTVDDQGKVVFLVTTMRVEETVRIISLRRAHFEERNVFAVITDFDEGAYGE